MVVLMGTAPVLATFHMPVSINGLFMSVPALFLVWGILAVSIFIPAGWVMGTPATEFLFELLKILTGMLHELALHPIWPFSWIYPAPYWVVFIYLGLLTWCCLSRPFKPGRIVIIAGLFILGGLHSIFTSCEPAPTLSLLDVGDGEAILLQMPGNHSVLVDTGGKIFVSGSAHERRTRGDLARRVLIPVLLERGIKRLDALVLTHFDFDHCGSVSGLLRWFPVDIIYCSQSEWDRDSSVLTEAVGLSGREPPAIIPLKSGDSLAFDSLRLDIYHPDMKFKGFNSNSNSLVIRGEIPPYSFLLTGDIDQGVEKILLRDDHLPQTSVLKCAHHGSRTSTSALFLDQVQPDLALISAGNPSRFSHPSPEVLSRLGERGVPWFSTYTHGQIILTFHQSGLEISFPHPPQTELVSSIENGVTRTFRE
jgi:beta-lactamase superfamily II metal-dependent hydrolase